MIMNYLNFKKLSLFLVMILFACGAAFAQGYNTTNWKFSNPKQFGFTLLDVDYFDNNTAIAVGSDGGIAKSTDGGRNWTYGVFTYINQTNFKVKPTFNDVHFITANIAYAVGNGGVMVKTTDAGVTWNLVTTPLWANTKNINTLWFLDANKGYIAGQWNNTVDSLPKLYFTLNGGSTWDSIAAPPVNGVTRCGYINNAGVPSVLYPVDAKLKEIYRIEFVNPTTAYICGSGSSLFPRVSITSSASPACVPNPAGNLTTGAHTAALLWKFSNGVLTDYSISKERIGYTGINTNTVTCTTGFANLTPAAQTYKAMGVINDSTVVLMSFNNNTVVKVRTGVNDSTLNVNAPGVYEKGKYEMLNFPSPPTQGPQAGPAIPPVQVLLASNPITIRIAASGKLIAGSQQSSFAGTPGSLWTSIDTGRNWIKEVPYPQTPNIIAAFPGAQVVDIAPNGRVLVMGTNGSVTDSLPGGSWQSTYVTVPVGASYNDMEFADCNNGIAAGGASITVTTDGGNTWIDRASPVLAALNASINSVNYLTPTKVYFTTSIGNVYRSVNQAANLSPVFGEPTARLFDLATVGTDSLWACGDLINSPLPSAQRSGVVYRSLNNGVSWDTVRVGPIGSATFITFRGIEFPTKSVGYIVGTRNSIYKTIDAGVTWTNISPIPALIATMSFSDVQALNKDTVFVTGVGFPFKVVYRTTDGGATWVDITNNILTTGVGNLNGILMHDYNNGYVMTPGGALLVTNNSGASWTLDLAPTNSLFATAAFVPKTVGPGVSMINRKMLVSGPNISGAPMMEYGNPANTQVNSTELIAGAACTTPNSGSITITATGGLAPYTYQLGAGPFQASNVFSGLAAGTYTITIKDAYCGLLTKTVTIALTDNQVLNTNITTATICAGAPVQLIASGNSTTYSWSPALGLSNPNIANPIASPLVTTTYTVTATLNGCVKTRSITINVSPNANLIIAADPGTTLCEGDPTLLSVFDAGVVVPPGNLYNQTGIPVAGVGSQNFEAANATFSNQGADDFTVPANTSWSVTQVNVTGSYSIAGVPTSINVFFYSNSGSNLPGVPVATFNNVTTYTGAGGAFNITLPSTLVLTAGTYWVSVQVNMSFATSGQWYWNTYGGTNVGSERAWQNPGGGFATPCNGWGYGATGCAVGTLRNHVFTIFGSSVSTGAQATGTFLWSPAAGLSSTTSNPVAASPMNTTTYSVTRTTVPGGCVASAQITINVNKRPTVTTHPVATVNCAGTTATFTVAGTGAGLTYQWQVSTNGCAGPWTNLANAAPYSGVNAATLSINPVTGLMTGYGYRCVLSGTCAPVLTNNISNCATLTVNPLPIVTINPAGPVCGGVAGINGTQLSTASTPPPVPGTVTVNSGTISVPVPDNNPAGATHTLAVSTVPANATITNIHVKWTMPHTWVGDMVFALKAPNGQILNLDYLISITGVGPSTGFVNTTVSSAGVNALSTGTDPYTGTFRADAVITNVNAGAGGPTGFTPTATTWPPLYTTANGNWVLAMKDGFGGDVGTLTNWTITFDYTTPGTTGSTLSYVWSPLAGLYTNNTAGTAYTGTNLSTVYAAPTVQTTYTATATDAVTGCVSSASVLVNYTPPAPAVTPNPVSMCLGDLPVKLKSASSTPGSCTTSSGAISIPVPDNTANGVQSNLTVSCVPAGAIVTGVSVNFNMANHTYVGDMILNLKAPNGTVLNLAKYMTGTATQAGAYPNLGFVNTTISSAGTAVLGTATTTPITGTWKADLLNAAVPFTIQNPVGFVSTAANWNALYSTPNGTWTLAMADGGAGDVGTLTSWSITVNYAVGVPSAAAVWSPVAGLFSNAAGTLNYVAGTAVDSVWAAPTTIGANNYQVTVNNLLATTATPTTAMAGGNGNNLVAFNVVNNNTIPVTFSSISSNSFASGAVTARVFYKPGGIAGAPGAISAANGWTQFGTSNVTVTANTLNPIIGGLTLTVPAGATFGIALDFTGATVPAYTNGAATTVTYSNGGCDIITGGNVGWGGPAAPGVPVNNPRNFNGSITFVGIGPGTCQSPARTVLVTVNQPTTLNANIPANQTICTDKVATFSTAVTVGSGPHSYQWQVSIAGGAFANIGNTGVYSGATTATLTVTAPPVSMNGYQYRCVVTGAAPCAAQISRVATLLVNPLPVIAISAAPFTSLLPGLRTTLSSTVTPNPVATYAWIRDGVALTSPATGVISGLGTGSIVVDVDGQGVYQLRVTDVNGCTNTSISSIIIKDSASAKCFMYPNPTNGQFEVRFYSFANNVLPRTLTIYNAEGQRVMTKRFGINGVYDRMPVDLRRYSKGVYTIEIGDLNGNRLTVCNKLVIQ
jgi:photosystem II stability/assembly factor-like uncharacterized protein/subtilisin-like proprotein convertase family protein